MKKVGIGLHPRASYRLKADKLVRGDHRDGILHIGLSLLSPV